MRQSGDKYESKMSVNIIHKKLFPLISNIYRKYQMSTSLNFIYAFMMTLFLGATLLHFSKVIISPKYKAQHTCTIHHSNEYLWE